MQGAFASNQLDDVAEGVNRVANGRSDAKRRAILFTMPKEWHSAMAPILSLLDDTQLGVLMAMQAAQWRLGYQQGHTDALRGQHINPGLPQTDKSEEPN